MPLPAAYPALNIAQWGVRVEELVPGLGAKDVALEILEASDLKTLLREQPTHSPQLAWLGDTISPPVGWLEAYWHGRLLGYWD